MKVAIYTRVSTRMQVEDGHSLEAQKDILTKFAEEKGYEVVGVYSDAGISGKRDDREAYNKVLELAQQKKIDGVLIWKLTRFSRNFRDLVNVASEFLVRKQTIISRGESFDLTSPTGRLSFRILAAVAEFERETTADNIRMAFVNLTENGRKTSHNALGYRSINNQYEIVPEEAKTVRAIFNTYLETQNQNVTCKRVNAAGYRSHYGNEFRLSTINTILHNPLYCGYSKLYNRIPVKEKTVPQIIDEETFNQVQLLSRKKLARSTAGKRTLTIDEWLKK